MDISFSFDTVRVPYVGIRLMVALTKENQDNRGVYTLNQLSTCVSGCLRTCTSPSSGEPPFKVTGRLRGRKARPSSIWG